MSDPAPYLVEFGRFLNGKWAKPMQFLGVPVHWVAPWGAEPAVHGEWREDYESRQYAEAAIRCRHDVDYATMFRVFPVGAVRLSRWRRDSEGVWVEEWMS